MTIGEHNNHPSQSTMLITVNSCHDAMVMVHHGTMGSDNNIKKLENFQWNIFLLHSYRYENLKKTLLSLLSLFSISHSNIVHFVVLHRSLLFWHKIDSERIDVHSHDNDSVVYIIIEYSTKEPLESEVYSVWMMHSSSNNKIFQYIL
jgi:hypothetical protein